MPRRYAETHVLIQPPLHDVGSHVFVNHPTGLLKIAALLRRRGHRLRWIDACPVLPGGWIDGSAAERHGPVDHRRCGVLAPGDLVKDRYRYGWTDGRLRERLRRLGRVDGFWIGSSMTFYWEGVHRAVALCRETHPGVPVTVGGIYATLCPDHARRSGAEVARGEVPEATDLPPAYDLLRPAPGYAIVKTTRGCPRRCTYCTVQLLEGNRIRHRPMDAVMAELRTHRARGLREFVFWESNVTLDAPEYLEPLLDRIARELPGIELTFPEGFSPEHLTPSLCRRLVRAGVRRVVLSLESSDDDLRRRWRKGGEVEAHRRAVERLRRAGLPSDSGDGDRHGLFSFVLAGLPDQSYASVLRTLRVAWRHGTRPLLMRFTPIPGSAEYARYRAAYERAGLEALTPGLWPGAGPWAPASYLEEIYRRFHGRRFDRAALRALPRSTPVLEALQSVGEP